MGCIQVKEVLSVVAFLLSLAILLVAYLKRKRKVNTIKKNKAVQSKLHKKEIAVQYTKSKEENVQITSITQEAKTIEVTSFKPKAKTIDITSFKPKKNKNLGNTCYFNAALQALYFTKSFRESLQCLQSSPINSQDLMLSKTVFDLMREAESDKDNSKELKNVFKAIKNIYRNDPFVIGKQEDSHELLNTLLAGIFDEIKTLVKDVSKRRRDPDWIDARNIFTGCFIIMYVYDSCEDVEVDFQKFFSLNIPISKSKDRNENNVPRDELQTISLKSPHEGLEEGLFDLERVEEDEEFVLPCRICNTVGSGRAYRRLLVFQPPPVLVLHIDRFKMDDSHRLTKNTKLLQYPKCLDMAKFCSAVGKERLQNRTLYELYAVIVHTGTIYSGHYYAYVNARRQHDVEKWQNLFKTSIEDEEALKEEVNCFFKRNDKKQKKITKASICSNLDVSNQTKSKRADVDAEWFCVSDENVKNVNEKEVLNHKDAYILFYEVQ